MNIPVPAADDDDEEEARWDVGVLVVSMMIVTHVLGRAGIDLKLLHQMSLYCVRGKKLRTGCRIVIVSQE